MEYKTFCINFWFKIRNSFYFKKVFLSVNIFIFFVIKKILVVIVFEHKEKVIKYFNHISLPCYFIVQKFCLIWFSTCELIHFGCDFLLCHKKSFLFIAHSNLQFTYQLCLVFTYCANCFVSDTSKEHSLQLFFKIIFCTQMYDNFHIPSWWDFSKNHILIGFTISHLCDKY